MADSFPRFPLPNMVLKTLFPESNWKLVIRKTGFRLELALHWGNKAIPTHVAAVDVEDVIKLIEGPNEFDC
jgi:hypothetical protein